MTVLKQTSQSVHCVILTYNLDKSSFTYTATGLFTCLLHFKIIWVNFCKYQALIFLTDKIPDYSEDKTSSNQVDYVCKHSAQTTMSIRDNYSLYICSYFSSFEVAQCSLQTSCSDHSSICRPQLWTIDDYSHLTLLCLDCRYHYPHMLVIISGWQLEYRSPYKLLTSVPPHSSTPGLTPPYLQRLPLDRSMLPTRGKPFLNIS